MKKIILPLAILFLGAASSAFTVRQASHGTQQFYVFHGITGTGDEIDPNMYEPGNDLGCSQGTKLCGVWAEPGDGDRPDLGQVSSSEYKVQ